MFPIHAVVGMPGRPLAVRVQGHARTPRQGITVWYRRIAWKN
jgi:hypothetical protein